MRESGEEMEMIREERKGKEDSEGTESEDKEDRALILEALEEMMFAQEALEEREVKGEETG